MKTFAIHSPNDAALLIRLHDDLVKSMLFSSDEAWNKWYNPIGRYVCGCLYVPADSELMYCHVEATLTEASRRDLTPSNYDAILSEIIESRS